MKKLNQICILLLLPSLFTLFTYQVSAQEDSVVAKELVKLKYFNDNNSVQFLMLENSMKTGNKIEPLNNKKFEVYLDSTNIENLVAKLTTNKNGKAKAILPPSLKEAWATSSLHKFIVVAEGKEEEDPVTELEITKAKIQIDTLSEEGVRSIKVQVMKFEKNEWLPANEVEMKVGIQRHGGILSAGDEETYTTDSSGMVMVELKKDSLPGDEKGNIVLVAKVEENDLYGNLSIEKTVHWGVDKKFEKNFFEQRTLWSTRFRTPFWLLFMAYSIVIGVWGTIIYLIFQMVKIKKLGISSSPS